MPFDAAQSGAIRVIRPRIPRPGPARITERAIVARQRLGQMNAPYRDVELSFRIAGDNLIVTASSIFKNPFYVWYQDGAYYRTTREKYCVFRYVPGKQSRVDCIDTTDENFDVIANAPENHSPIRTIYWIRSLSDDVDYYIVEFNKAGAGWEELGQVDHDESKWEYSLETDRLDDLTEYEFRVTPYDDHDNPGTARTISSEKIVRYPDAPDFSVSYSDSTNKISWS